MGSMDLNPGPQACTTTTLAHEIISMIESLGTCDPSKPFSPQGDFGSDDYHSNRKQSRSLLLIFP